MDIDKLNEELAKLNEMEVTKSFKDYMNMRRDAQRNTKKQDVDRYASYMKDANDPDYWKESYERALKKYVGKQEVDKMFKQLYDKLNIDIEHSTITEVEVPNKASKLKQLAKEHNVLLFLLNNKLVIVKSCMNYDKFEVYGLYAGYGDANFTSNAMINWKDVDLTKPNSLSQAINAGKFEKAWAIDAPSTNDIKNQRAERRKGAKAIERTLDYWSAEKDKSGYFKRNLKQELGNLKNAAFQKDIEAFKASAVDLRKKFVAHIKQSDTEDIDLNKVYSIIELIRKVENTYSPYKPDSADIKRIQANMKQLYADIENKISEL